MLTLVNMLGVDMVELGVKPELPAVRDQPQWGVSQEKEVRDRCRGERN